jgi:hypothetical protein
MLSRAGIAFDPGRDKDREIKGEEGAVEDGVMLNRLDAKAAPSASPETLAGTSVEMTELRGRAKPRIPSKSDDNVSEAT